MRNVKKVLSFHFEEGRSGRFIARHCGMARRSVAQTLERFAASGLSWPQVRDLCCFPEFLSGSRAFCTALFRSRISVDRD